MKRLSILASLVVLVIACNDNNEIDGPGNGKTETSIDCKTLNADIAALASTVKAIVNTDYVYEVSPLVESSTIVGTYVEFVYAGKQTFHNGYSTEFSNPSVGVKNDNGSYYWTLNAEYLLDGSGSKISVGADNAVAPQLKAEKDYWFVSSDGGKTWRQLDAITKGISSPVVKTIMQEETGVAFQLPDGTSVKANKLPEIYLNVETDGDIACLPGKSIRIPYNVYNAIEKCDVSASTTGGWSATVESQGDTQGSILITAPEPIANGDITLTVKNNAHQEASKNMKFVEGVLQAFTDVTTISAAGGSVRLNVNTNVSYSLTVSDNAKEWLTVDTGTKATMKSDIIYLWAKKNTTRENRNAAISLIDDSGKTIETINLVQEWSLYCLPAELELSQYEFTQDENIAEVTFTLSSTRDWHVVKDTYWEENGWASIVPGEGKATDETALTILFYPIQMRDDHAKMVITNGEVSKEIKLHRIASKQVLVIENQPASFGSNSIAEVYGYKLPSSSVFSVNGESVQADDKNTVQVERAEDFFVGYPADVVTPYSEDPYLCKIVLPDNVSQSSSSPCYGVTHYYDGYELQNPANVGLTFCTAMLRLNLNNYSSIGRIDIASHDGGALSGTVALLADLNFIPPSRRDDYLNTQPVFIETKGAVSCSFEYEKNEYPNKTTVDIPIPPQKKFSVLIFVFDKSGLLVDSNSYSFEEDIVIGSTYVVDLYGGIDLGLPSGNIWAYGNIGAVEDYQYGKYFAWAELTPNKTYYKWETYQWYNSSSSTLTKYNTGPGADSFYSDLTILPEDDIATQTYGSGWHIGTDTEWEELFNEDNCTCQWTNAGGYKAYIITSKRNGNTLRLPAAGVKNNNQTTNGGKYCYYWTSTLIPWNNDYQRAYRVFISESGVNMGEDYRYMGMPIRGVKRRYQ